MNLYSLAVNLIWWYANLFFNLNVTGLDNIPKDKGFLVTANHLSYFDPFLVAKYIPGQIHFIAMEELFSNPIMAFVMKRWKTIPIKRGSADKTAIRKALSLLKNDRIVGIFPEGGIIKKHTDSSFQTGSAMLAIHSQKYILPVYIEGTRNLYRPSLIKRKPVRVVFKKPFKVQHHKGDDKKELRARTIQHIEQQLKAQI